MPSPEGMVNSAESNKILENESSLSQESFDTFLKEEENLTNTSFFYKKQKGNAKPVGFKMEDGTIQEFKSMTEAAEKTEN